MKSILTATLFLTFWLTAPIGQGAEGKDQLLVDVHNHTTRLSSVINDKSYDQVQNQAKMLRNDLQSLLKRANEVPANKQQIFRDNANQAISLTQAIERNADKSNQPQLQASYRSLETAVAAVESAFGSGSEKAVVKSAAGSAANQLMSDIENHNRKLGKMISDRKFDQAHNEAELLQNDVSAMVKKSDLKSDKREGNLKDHEKKVIELTNEVEKQCQKGDYNAAKEAYDKLQGPVKAILALRSNVIVNQERLTK